jgi:hypothetical protein
MSVSDDWKKTVRLNKLLGMWPPKNWESRAGTLTPIRVDTLDLSAGSTLR